MKYCAIYYRKDADDLKIFHSAHRSWIYSLKPAITTSFIPNFLNAAIFGRGVAGQLLSFLKGLFMPSADAYIMEGVACLPATFFRKGKRIVINTDTFVKDLETMKGIRKKYSLWLMNKVDGFISTSEMMKELTEKYCRKPNTVIYPISHLERFHKANADLKSGNICAIGLSIQKGTDILVDVYKKYQKQYPSAKLFVCGESNYRKEIQGVNGVVAPGRVDPKIYLEKSSICMNCARHEPFGLNILEAMAAGVVPIVSEHCGAKTFVKMVDKKLVVPLDAQKFLKTAVWLRESGKIKELSEKCRAIAQRFEKENKLIKFKIAVESIIKK